MATIVTIVTLLILPFFLEATIKIGFSRPDEKRHVAFYLLTPVTSLLVYLTLAALLGHPGITFIGWLFVYAGLAAVSNVKNRVLGEPICAPDLETARHLFIYPEFYVDYVGAKRVVAIFGSFALAVILACTLETSFVSHQSLLPAPAAWALGLLGWMIALYLLARISSRVLTHARARSLGLTFDINTDTARFGYFPLMLLYGLLLMDRSEPAAPDTSHPPLSHKGKPGGPPDIIAFQAESYFDIDRLYRRIPGYEDHTWPALDGLRKNGVSADLLHVPAWGASTMQSEFAFLSGIANENMGVDRINPYQRAAHTGIETIATRLKSLGYRTVCVHPAKKEFFRRSSVIPKMGFDDFIGVEAFSGASRFGPYISDEALGDLIERTIADHKKTSDQPLFVFSITIESHGPWDEGRLAPWLDEGVLAATDPTGDRSFAIYRQHMDNVLALFSRLGPEAAPDALKRPRTMALYGDHQPAFHDLFDRHGFTDSKVDYLLWHSGCQPEEHGALRVENLADKLLEVAGFHTPQS
ncbi:LTA synthase family protein [Kordiimonas sp.]|uniref:LTA synthase family protein n=1 Tax=Kordiimonas sp. TaxID=1970157 RepID=UPI003A90801B